MKTSNELKNITIALIEIQKGIPIIEKEKQGYGYKYASFDNIINIVKKVCNNNKMAIIQSVGQSENGVTITTRLQHESGEYIEDGFELPATTMKGVNNVQALGASITYGKRYGLSAMLGVATDEDIDCNVDTIKKSEKNNNTTEHPFTKLVKSGIPKETIIKYVGGKYKIDVDKLNDNQIKETVNFLGGKK